MESNHSYQFGPYRLEPATGLLWKDGHRIPLTPRVIDTLVVLVKGAGNLVTKDELLQAVWPDTHVEEGNLAQNISVLRRALGGEGFIETLPKRGYRFIAPVEEIWERPVMDGLPAEPSPIKRKTLWLAVAICAFVLLAAVGYRTFKPASRGFVPGATEIPDTEAYLHYLDGRRQWSNRTLAGVHEAIKSFRRVTQEDPEYAPAYSGLADSLILLGSYGVYAPKEIFPQAKSAALHALRLDDNLAEAHASLGEVKGVYDWDWKGAEEEFAKAIHLKPDYATAHQWYAEELSALGRNTEAIREAQKAVEVEPHSPTVISIFGLTLYFARQNEAAIAQYKKALQFDPNHLITYFFLGYVYERMGKIDEAASAFRTGVKLAGGAGAAHLAHLQAVSGNRNEALRTLEELKTRATTQYVSPLDFAIVYAGLGDKEATLIWMERACEDHSQLLEHLAIDPRYDGLRSDRRFQSLLRKMHLQ